MKVANKVIFDYLKKQSYIESFVENTIKSNWLNAKVKLIALFGGFEEDSISTVFKWNSTKEGYKFWEDRCDELSEFIYENVDKVEKGTIRIP